MERGDQISEHEVRVYIALSRGQEWCTVAEVAKAAKVARRTAQGHLVRLAKCGLAAVQKVTGGYRYLAARTVPVEAAEYVVRLREARTAFKL